MPRGGAAGGAGPEGAEPPASAKDWAGWIERRERGRLRSKWRLEWCVSSVNFLTFFRTRAALDILRCVLFSAVREVRADGDGRTLRVQLQERPSASGGVPSEELVLRVPSPKRAAALAAPAASAAELADELRRRAGAAASSAGGPLGLVACVGLGEFERRAAAILEGGPAGAVPHEARARLAAGALRLALAPRLQSQRREAFEEWARWHWRCAADESDARAAASCLFRGHFGAALLGEAFSQWACGTVRLRKRDVRLGVAILHLFMRARGRQAARSTLSHLRACGRSGEESARRAPAPRALRRLRAGGALLHGALQAAGNSQKGWAMRHWSSQSARSARAESAELIRSTSELNALLVQSAWSATTEWSAKLLVLALHSARSRRLGDAFGVWSCSVSGGGAGRPAERAPAPESPRGARGRPLG